MGASCGLETCSRRLGALPVGVSIGLSLGLFKVMIIISFWDTSTELHGGSSGRVEVPGLTESVISPALLRTLHDHHRLEEFPADLTRSWLESVHSQSQQPGIWVSLVSLVIVFLNSQENSREQNWRLDILFLLTFNCNTCPSCSFGKFSS